jgi:hypothetical protein
LIGWRVDRRFGWRGQIAFVAFMSIWGPMRSRIVAAASGASALTPGLVGYFASAVIWACAIALSQGVMHLVAGPAQRDRLARNRLQMK